MVRIDHNLCQSSQRFDAVPTKIIMNVINCKPKLIKFRPCGAKLYQFRFARLRLLRTQLYKFGFALYKFGFARLHLVGIQLCKFGFARLRPAGTQPYGFGT